MSLRADFIRFSPLMLLLFASSTLSDSIELLSESPTTGWNSLALDSGGNPVVTYGTENIDGRLIVEHCNDVNCAGGDESVEDFEGQPSEIYNNSLALDSSGNPVVAYHVADVGLKVLHCNDVNCAGHNESIEIVDPIFLSYSISMVLDGSGNPVVSYYDVTNADLKILHCNDVNCAGGDESIVSVDTAGNVGRHNSLALDGSGNPVVSYYDETNGDLKILHCNDVNCAGGNESIVSVDTAGNVGRHNSLALDGSGNPVVSYYDETNGDLKILHCNDVNCAGGNESIVSVDTAGSVSVGRSTSLALDGSGNPVVSYQAGDAGLKIMHCNDVNCAGGDESIEIGDPASINGCCTSLALDSSGNPVVSYYYSFKGPIFILHCNDANCAAEVTIDIKPGKTPNSINPSGKGKIPVAVLTTESFDATQVDWQTVLFGPDGATEFHGRSHVKDVDGDGNMDSLFHFDTQETGIACGDAEVMLTGETFGGEAFHGSDSITTVKCD